MPSGRRSSGHSRHRRGRRAHGHHRDAHLGGLRPSRRPAERRRLHGGPAWSGAAADRALALALHQLRKASSGADHADLPDADRGVDRVHALARG